MGSHFIFCWSLVLPRSYKVFVLAWAEINLLSNLSRPEDNDTGGGQLIELHSLQHLSLGFCSCRADAFDPTISNFINALDND